MCQDLDLLKTPLFLLKKLQRDTARVLCSQLTGRLLDIGCGIRPYARFTNANSYIGIDCTQEVVPDLLADSADLPFTDCSFDSALCTEVLEHVPNPERVMSEISRILRTGGCLYVTVPMSWCLHYEPYDFYRYTRYGLEYLAHQAGFDVIEIERIGGLFSLCGVRFADVLAQTLVRLLPFLSWRIRERIGALVVLPISVCFYLIGKLCDPIDHRDAIGWAMVATKR